ncbi:hypothetical protein LX83_003140 [Goodfellowiella coeruleoviolacea]|uniref:Uncharacterized protein n=1 Tax=Goodfellowiella coeruleoviolacea TaxID=334858 RepID=A0AAE3KFD9_9PSEU|nr:hypothetical protein [Goodfellowiella coeruleoviolacea]
MPAAARANAPLHSDTMRAPAALAARSAAISSGGSSRSPSTQAFGTDGTITVSAVDSSARLWVVRRPKPKPTWVGAPSGSATHSRRSYQGSARSGWGVPNTAQTMLSS